MELLNSNVNDSLGHYVQLPDLPHRQQGGYEARNTAQGRNDFSQPSYIPGSSQMANTMNGYYNQMFIQTPMLSSGGAWFINDIICEFNFEVDSILDKSFVSRIFQ